MYKYDRSLILVTIPSPVKRNLALLDVDEHLNAETLAVVHDGYMNIIPVLSTTRRAKYVSLLNGSSRGTGVVKEVKWLRIKGETVFVVMSNNGIHIYDAEVTDIKFYHCCKDRGDEDEYTIGACVIKSEMLCIGTSSGTIWVFSSNETNTQFNMMDRLYAHDTELTLLDGSGEYMVSSSIDTTYLWLFKKREFTILRKIQVPGLLASPVVLKLASCLAFIGYDSGEFCIFDFTDDQVLTRTVAHKLELSAIDFSPLTYMVLTASVDGYVKIWTYKHRLAEAICLFSLYNEDGPVCSAAFLNYNCTEFCIVTANQVSVHLYVQDYKDNKKPSNQK